MNISKLRKGILKCVSMLKENFNNNIEGNYMENSWIELYFWMFSLVQNYGEECLYSANEGSGDGIDVL